jgi:hypothetical protein
MKSWSQKSKNIFAADDFAGGEGGSLSNNVAMPAKKEGEQYSHDEIAEW